MAFRQPTLQHQVSRHSTAPLQTTATPAQAPVDRSPTDSQEWILFSPSAADSATSTTRTRTAGLSRVSDFGSLDTAARSYGYDVDDGSSQAVDDAEDGELDSLDSHLHEFRAEPSIYRGETSGTVLPTHDGFGSFRVDRTAMGSEVQEHLYAFELFNPRRVNKRRRASVELDFLDEEAAEAERTRRIEKWRMDQSILLRDEIQKETRRRKQSMSSERRVTVVDKEQEDLATLSVVVDETPEEDENESFWSRITKRVIKDLMGVDDELLSIIFGESLPADDDLSTTPPANGTVSVQEKDQYSWEYRLMERIARELGILVNQLSDHPGAFSTYLHTQTTPLPYAGLPVIPESARDQASPPTPEFAPTLQTQPVPIPTSTSLASPSLPEDATPRANYPITREEWEKDLDIKMVFRYLRSRFTSKFTRAPKVSPTLPQAASFASPDFSTSHLATASTTDTAARAARVRQHHPLVTGHGNRRRSIERRTWRPSVPVAEGLMRRSSSSCASGSGKRKSGSSRHYWDFGAPGSVGSGSLVAAGRAGGAMGSWGEV